MQTLMDRMTREREEESERLRTHYEQLQANYTTSEVSRTKFLTSLIPLLLIFCSVHQLNFQQKT